MTREEAMAYAISKKAGIESEINKSHCGYGNWVMYSAALDFINAAISALKGPTREQVEKVWRGCDLCLDDSWQRNLMVPKRFDHTSMLSAELAQFCPGCGRPLTDEAVDMVMERLEAMKDG